MQLAHMCPLPLFNVAFHMTGHSTAIPEVEAASPTAHGRVGCLHNYIERHGCSISRRQSADTVLDRLPELLR
jgi:hypothetical protein